MINKSIEVGGRELTIESGKLAKQADGSVVVGYGDTRVLVTACYSKEIREDIDFMPLTVDYREFFAAAGKIPGGFFKREGRPKEREILVARLIDRSIRPLFPDNFHQEVQIIGFLLSSDLINEADVLGINGASIALGLSEIPFNGPIGAVRVGLIDGSLKINPTIDEQEVSSLNLVVAGKKDGVIMMEGGSREIPNELMLEAIELAHTEIRKIISLQEELMEDSKEKISIPQVDFTSIESEVESYINDMKDALNIFVKQERRIALETIREKIHEAMDEKFSDQEAKIDIVFDKFVKQIIREKILKEGTRIDGRTVEEIRPISCEVGLLPRTHGSALFTRGETQSLAVATLGTKGDEQLVDDVEKELYKSFMLHYNFPPFSTNEVKPMRGPSRREIGHGHLAERSVEPVLPDDGEFPYTIRIISNILESNGSSSMASVCGASLSLMDAGVPIKKPVAGISIGLIKEGKEYVLLTDILGDEDHYGDMDFKVAGTTDGITGIQLDLKIDSIDIDMIKEILERAYSARLKILNIMQRTISEPRKKLSKYAPKISVFYIPRTKIGDVIGPGGRVIKSIIEKTQTEIEIDDKESKVIVSGTDDEKVSLAVQMVKDIIAEVEIGVVYTGTVKRITSFGAFVEILPGKEGLLHISKISNERVKNVEDYLKVGDKVEVEVLEIDKLGRVNLIMKGLTKKTHSKR